MSYHWKCDSAKGSKKPYTENSPETYLFELNYIELPATLNYQVKKGISMKVAGTAFSWLQRTR